MKNHENHDANTREGVTKGNKKLNLVEDNNSEVDDSTGMESESVASTLDKEEAKEEVVDPMVQEMNKLKSDLSSAQEARDEANDQLMRKMAEIDNQRKRMQREKEEWLRFSHEEIAKDLLVVLDNFEAALNHEMKQDNKEVSSFIKGIELNAKSFREILKKHGVEEIESLNKTFDPNFHSAVSQIEKDDCEDQTVIEVFQKGYMIHNRLLRPSMVKVSVKP